MNDKLKLTPEGVCVFKEDTHLSRWVEEHKSLLAGAWLPFLEEHIHPGSVVIDIGASIGDHTLASAQRVGPTGTVFAFEANDVAAEALTYNLREYPQVIIYNQALGDLLGWARIVRLPNVGASYLLDDPDGDIPYLSLDYIADRDEWMDAKIDFIKLDAEGWEPRILAGASRLIAKHRPVMWIEINRLVLPRQGSSPEALLAQLDAMGYQTFPQPEAPEYDTLALPRP